MPAFGDPWGDIDRTRPGQIYLVESDGWGWFMIFILLALPFFILGLFLTQLSAAICEHPYITICVYSIFAIVFSIAFNIFTHQRFKVVGTIATILTLTPIFLVQILYMIPYISQNSLFGAVFEWLVVTAMMVGLTFFILAMMNLLKNGWIHLGVAAVFLALTVFILYKHLSSS
ncbi:MAG: hypothetical protein ACI4XW_07535, partial [Candidatus Spyradocola sp.]